MTAKPTDADDWIAAAKTHGRGDDIVVVNDAGHHRINIVDYEMHSSTKGAGQTESLVQLIVQLCEVVTRQNDQGDVWQRAMTQFLRNSIDLLRLAGQPVRLADVAELSTNDEYSEDLCGDSLRRQAVLSGREKADLAATQRYFTEWREMNDRTKSSVRMTLTSLLDPMMRGSLAELFTEDTTVTPDALYAGKIIVVDLPVLSYNIVGRIANVAWKLIVQRSVQRRTSTDHDRPIFIFGDESQHFRTSFDSLFLTTSRAARCATVYATQNLETYYEAGGTKESVSAMMGNMATIIGHANAHNVTNDWFANTVAKVLHARESTSANYNASGGNSGGKSTAWVRDYDLDPRVFLTLDCGGPPFDYLVAAVLFQSGLPIGRDRSIYRIILFDQQTL